MRPLPVKGATAFAGLTLMLSLTACTSTEEVDPSAGAADNYTTAEVTDGTTAFTIVTNPNGGAELSYATDGPISLIEETDADGYTLAFKDFNGNGTLESFEDWRVAPAERAAAYAATLTPEQISGLMLFSNHERAAGDGLTDAQKTYLSESNLRNVLNASGSDVEENVTWVNEMQAYVETLATADAPYIPANFSSDPRNEATAADAGTVGQISRWPSSLGLAATFSPETAELFGRYISEEYRALGITNALSPQIDLATDPRWLRDSGTLGENAALASELAAAIVAGYQGTYDEEGNNLGWGMDSVPTMIKHAPGDGGAEGGRESHTDAGKYAVPGEHMADSLEVFAAASDSIGMMTNYSITMNPDGTPIGDEFVGTAYNTEIMRQIRDQFDGVIVTDWAVMNAQSDPEGGWQGMPFGTAWGVENMTPVERYVRVMENGIDQFGGVNDATYILQAYDAWDQKFAAGEEDEDAATRWAESGTRILTGFFATGVFDSPFVDLDDSLAEVGSQEKVDAGYQAQLDSVVMLKNDGAISEATLEDWADKTVYIPWTHSHTFDSVFGPGAESDNATLTIEVAEQYFANVVTDTVEYDENGVVTSITAPDLSDVDIALVGMRSPQGGAVFANSGYDAETDTWYPISLQYRPYTADGPNVRQVSITGDILADGTKQNRSYYGNTGTVGNEADLDAFERARAAADASGKDIPVIVALKATNPVVPTEFEADADAIIVGFGTSDKALFDVALGLFEPQGRLPIGFPASMDAVEASSEGIPEDVVTFVDESGNDWAFGYGLNWSGVIAG